MDAATWRTTKADPRAKPVSTIDGHVGAADYSAEAGAGSPIPLGGPAPVRDDLNQGLDGRSDGLVELIEVGGIGFDSLEEAPLFAEGE